MSIIPELLIASIIGFMILVCICPVAYIITRIKNWRENKKIDNRKYEYKVK
jgi:uncharacterized membrane protein YciS (DUF1049 family)